jgi:arginine repressor
VAGSIAGDDTGFVACPDHSALKRASGRIRELIGG